LTARKFISLVELRLFYDGNNFRKDREKGIDMADERKWGKAEGPEPPKGKGAMGRAEPPADDEAGGRSKQFVATCFTCGASSYIGADWKWFTCWKCGSTSSEMVA
jgi:ribosomal protein S27AE